jgi:hypothetical protein
MHPMGMQEGSLQRKDFSIRRLAGVSITVSIMHPMVMQERCLQKQDFSIRSLAGVSITVSSFIKHIFPPKAAAFRNESCEARSL